MIKSYFKTALRFLLKNKTYSFINIIGLAIGTLSCIYILLYVQDQYSYDDYQPDANAIYRVTTQMASKGDARKFATSSPPIGPAMKRDFAEVDQYARVVPSMGVSKHLLNYGLKSLYETDAFYADADFFKIFGYHFVAGNPASALSAPYSIVLQQSTAEKLFGYDNPINKVITFDDSFGRHDFKVTGVIDNSLGKSHLQVNMLLSINSGGMGDYVVKDNTWSGNNFVSTYIKLRPDADAKSIESKLPAFLNKYGGQQLKELGMEKQLHLQPIKAIHTTNGFDAEISKTVSPSFLYTLSLIAVLIQVTACINFMNLSTARASKRAKEVGVRKVIGASKSDLIRQFIGESFLLSFISVIIALPLLLLLLPYLNSLTQADIHIHANNYTMWLMLAALVTVTGLLAGSYPAFYLSAFKTISVIKGNVTNQVSAVGLRRSLVVFQFIISIVLIIGIIVIYSQLNYIKNKDLGFNQQQKLIFRFYTGSTQHKIDGFANDLRQLPEIKNTSRSNASLGEAIMRDHGVYLSGGNMTNAVDAQNITTDKNYISTAGIKLISGRNFTESDSGKVLINETMMHRLGLNVKNAPGTRLYTQYLPNPATYVEVAGVLKDFNFNSLHGDIKPFMFMYDDKQGDMNNLMVATDTKDYPALLRKIEQLWHNDIPSAPFEFAFLDNEVQKQYEAEITLSHIINSFTLIAIFISCLGLFGLAAFSAEQRIKEIGVRKVLGASTTGIVKLLSADFLKLVFAAIIIAVPVSWWAMSKWLQAFAYHIHLSWWMFTLAGLAAITIALLTVSFQAVKAALVNPVKSLRSE
ncbi:ABC transporter permease [Mucilaginibacter koreensis]